MEERGYFQPESCCRGKEYYIKANGKLDQISYTKVEFLKYRPHPAEVLVLDCGKPRVIHRINLYRKREDEFGPLYNPKTAPESNN